MWFITILILIFVGFSMSYILPFLGYPDEKIVPDLLINLIAGGIFFVIGISWDKIRSLASLDFLWLRYVFGSKSVVNGQLNITVDTYNDTRPVGPPRFIKTFPDSHQTTMTGPMDRLTGYCSVRAAGYLMEKFSPYFKKRVAALSDEEVAAKWEGTFINLGVSALNIKTDDIKHHLANNLFKEDINGIIELKNGLSFKPENRHAVGMILKINNPHFGGHSLLVCAGIDEWGTSGAAWYLSRYWKKLGRKYFTDDFVVILRVLRGSDESSTEVYSTESRIERLLNNIKKMIKNI
jgi:hypothetical protein